MNITIIPSWYPTKANPIQGVFFEQQANFASLQGYNIMIVYIEVIENKCKFSFLNKERLIFDTNLTQKNVLYGKYYLCKRKKNKNIHKIANAYLKGLTILKEKYNWETHLIHAQSTHNAGIISYLIHQKTKTPYIISEHNSILLNFTKQLDKLALENARTTSVPSNYLKRHLLNQNAKINPIIIPNLIDEEFFIPKSNLVEEAFTITTVTYDHFIKDFDTFLNVINTLKNFPFNKKIEIIIIANDNFNNTMPASTSLIEEKSNKLLEKNNYSIQYIAQLTPEKIASVYQKTDVLISTSISETFGLAIREAMLCGVPVITTKNGGAEDVIINNRNGYLTEIKDYESIAKHIFEISISNPFCLNTLRETIVKSSGKNAFAKKLNLLYSNNDKRH